MAWELDIRAAPDQERPSREVVIAEVERAGPRRSSETDWILIFDGVLAELYVSEDESAGDGAPLVELTVRSTGRGKSFNADLRELLGRLVGIADRLGGILFDPDAESAMSLAGIDDYVESLGYTPPSSEPDQSARPRTPADLGREEGEALFRRYLESAPRRLAWLRTVSGADLPATREGLVEAWEWQVGWFDGGAWQLEVDDVPVLASPDGEPVPDRHLTRAARLAADALGFLFAEAAKAAEPRVRWQHYWMDPKENYAWQNLPVIALGAVARAPYWTHEVALLKLKDGNDAKRRSDAMVDQLDRFLDQGHASLARGEAPEWDSRVSA